MDCVERAHPQGFADRGRRATDGLVSDHRGQLIEVGLELTVGVAAFGTVEDAVAAMREGASDYLSKPFAELELELAIERALEQSRLVRENSVLREALDDRLRLDNLIAAGRQPRKRIGAGTVGVGNYHLLCRH